MTTDQPLPGLGDLHRAVAAQEPSDGGATAALTEGFALRRRTPEEREAYMQDKMVELVAENAQLKAKVAEYENAITWNTSCLSCSRLLDQLIAAESERDHLRGRAPSPEEMLREFHASKHIHADWMPGQPTADIPAWIRTLRADLLEEEAQELREAVAARDIAKIADALGDIEYVCRGTAVVYGIPSDAVLAEVHRSNMTKDNSPAEAKLVKGPGYEPPDIAGVLGLREGLDV